MSQGFITEQNITLPLAISQGGTGQTSGTGTGLPSFQTSPTFITPTLGVATATSLTFSPTTDGIVGTTTNDSASAGYVGEFISSVIPYASSVTLMTNSAADITSILLTEGDWDVWGNFTITDTVNTLLKSVGWTSTSSASVPDRSLYSGYYSTTTSLSIYGGPVAMLRYSLSGSTTIYLSTEAQFASGSTTVCGGIYARRVR